MGSPHLLKEEALKILHNRKKQFKDPGTLGSLEWDLSLHQIELELQNKCLLERETELKNLLDKYQMLYESAPVGHYTLDSNGLIIKANELGASLLGIDPLILLKKSFLRYIDPSHRITFANFRKNLSADEKTQTCELKLMRKMKPPVWVQIEGKCILQDGDTEFLLCVTDVNKQKEIYETSEYNHYVSEKRLSGNLELTSVIMHELNHPLASIANFLQGCIKRIQKDDYDINEILQILKLSAQQSFRAAAIMMRMKDFLNDDFCYAPVCLDELINETIKLIPIEIADIPVSIIYRASPNLPPAEIDKIQIQQVLLNLVRNAVESMHDVNTHQPKLTIEVQAGQRNSLEIYIQDNGPGIDNVIIERLFMTNSTSKKYGLGLGLILSKAIIEAHQGKLHIMNNTSGGACIKMTIPIVQTEIV